MNNREWLQELASNDVHALNAWFDSEHVEDANGTLDALSDGLDAKFGDCTDSREKLEADMENAIAEYGAAEWIAGSNDEMLKGYDYDVFFKLLDRQAAMTAHANNELIKWQAATVSRLQAERDELQAKVDELTADLKDEGRTVNELGDENLALKADNALLLDANAKLQRSLAEASEECDSYREKLGEALDYAAAILRLAD